jgi:hypothetical protein
LSASDYIVWSIPDAADGLKRAATSSRPLEVCTGVPPVRTRFTRSAAAAMSEVHIGYVDPGECFEFSEPAWAKPARFLAAHPASVVPAATAHLAALACSSAATSLLRAAITAAWHQTREPCRPVRAANYPGAMAARPWPELRDEDRWLIDAMERRISETTQSPDELRARAQELRADAAASDVKGVRDAKLALADRYEQAAITRLPT